MPPPPPAALRSFHRYLELEKALATYLRTMDTVRAGMESLYKPADPEAAGVFQRAEQLKRAIVASYIAHMQQAKADFARVQ